MDNGNNYMAVNFAMQLVQLYLIDDRNNLYVNETDLYHTTDALIRITSHSRQPPPEGLGTLIEMLRINQDPSTYLGERSPIGPTAHIHSAIHQVRVNMIHFYVMYDVCYVFLNDTKLIFVILRFLNILYLNINT